MGIVSKWYWRIKGLGTCIRPFVTGLFRGKREKTEVNVPIYLPLART